MIDITLENFQTELIDGSMTTPVLLDIWAEWCGPCKQLGPVLEKLEVEYGGRFTLAKLDADKVPQISQQLSQMFGVRSIPFCVMFKDGQPVDGFMGAIPESQINEFITKVGGKGNGAPPVAEALAAAAEARDAGDMQTAADIYDTILAQAPETIEAIAGLGDLLFEAGDAQGAEALLATAPQAKKDAPPLAALRAKMAVAAQAAALGNPAEFERRLAENPKDHQARFDLAMIQNARGDRTAAADNLLAIIKADRAWNEDGARTQLLQLFEAWGMTDEATLAARRKLSALLFS